MIELDRMISEAQARREAARAAVEAHKAERQQNALAAFQGLVEELFGAELLRELSVQLVLGYDYDHVTTARLVFRARVYSLYCGRHDWTLTRLEERENSERYPFPRAEFHAHYSNGLSVNQDALLVALADLAAQVDVAPPAREARAEPERPAPRTCSPHEAQLLDALRNFIQQEAPATDD